MAMVFATVIRASETDVAAVAAIPNGDNVRVNGHWWGNPLRATPRGSSLAALTAFGTDLQAAGNTWTAALCAKDSDGDGFTNGEELGDPSCTWTPGTTPSRTTDITHPGLWSSVPTTSAYPSRSQTYTPSACVVPTTQPPKVSDERAALTGTVAMPSGLIGVSREAELAIPLAVDSDDSYVQHTFPGNACPYLASGLKPWHAAATWASGAVPTAGSDVTLPAGTNVLVTSCSLPDAGFASITIPAGSALIFDDSPIHLRVKQIVVNGAMYVGGKACPVSSPITISFVARASEASTYNNGINVYNSGVLDFVGVTSTVNWGRLRTTAMPGSTFIVMQQAVDWAFGDEVVIATSIWRDTIDDQNEVRRVLRRHATNNTLLQLDKPLLYKHYAWHEYQSEVALLTRSILLRGTLDSDSISKGYGGHTWAVGSSATYRMVGVRAEGMGQQNVMARYPFHLHMMYEGGANSYIVGCSCVHSNYRCYTIHGTNHSLIRRSVSFNSTGHTYYLEDGGEMYNVIAHNAAIKVNILGVPAGGGAQVGESDFISTPSVLLPADRTASGYYIPNAANWIRGNTASGGWSGFAFPVFDTCLKLSTGISVIPKAQQILEFNGNTAHSSGHYWGDAGCIYAGGRQYQDSNGNLWYTNGRYSQPTVDASGKQVWQNITNLRAWLCQKGYSSWGDRVDLTRYECHDCTRSAVLFGQSSVTNMIVNGVSENRPYDMIGVYRVGFGFYDTWVQTMIVNITFRNIYVTPSDAPWGASAAIVDLDHSDIFKPWGISATRNLRFDTIERRRVIRRWVRESGASRMYNFVDWDSSVINGGTCQGQIVGSNIDWWNAFSDCWYEPLWPAWVCPRTPGREVVGLDMELPGISATANTIDIRPDDNTGLITQAQRNQLYIGNMSYFGSKSNQRLQLTRNHHLATGISATAWYMYLTTGVPTSFTIYPINFPRGAYIILAISLPSDAVVQSIETHGTWINTIPIYYTQVASRDLVINGNGTQYAFDGRHLYLKISDMHSPYPNSYSRGNVDIFSTQSSGGYNAYVYVTLQCPTKNSGGFCTTPTQPDPPADLASALPLTTCDNITQFTTPPPLCPSETNVPNPSYAGIACSNYKGWQCTASWPKGYCRQSCLPQCIRNAPYPYTCSLERGCTATEKPDVVVDWCRELSAGRVSGGAVTSDPCFIARCNGTSRSMERISLSDNAPCYAEDKGEPILGGTCRVGKQTCIGTTPASVNVSFMPLYTPGQTGPAEGIDVAVKVNAGAVTSATAWYRFAHDGIQLGRVATRTAALSLKSTNSFNGTGTAAWFAFAAATGAGRIAGNLTIVAVTSNFGTQTMTITDIGKTSATNPIVTVVSSSSSAVVLSIAPLDHIVGVTLESYVTATAVGTALANVQSVTAGAYDQVTFALSSALPTLAAGTTFAVKMTFVDGTTQRTTLPCLGVADGTASLHPVTDPRPKLSSCAVRLVNGGSSNWWLAVTPLDTSPLVTKLTSQFGSNAAVTIPQVSWGYAFQGNPGNSINANVTVTATLSTGATETWLLTYPFPASSSLLICVSGSLSDPEAQWKVEAPRPASVAVGKCVNGGNFGMTSGSAFVAPSVVATAAPDPTTPTPVISPPTAAPVATTSTGAKVLFAATLKLNGDYFGNLVNNGTTQRSRLVNALIMDLASLLKVKASRIEIAALAVGSLIVNYTVAQNTSESTSDANSLVTSSVTTMNLVQGQAVMTNTAALYQTDAVPAGANATVTVAGTTIGFVSATNAPSPQSTPAPSSTPSVRFAAALVVCALSLLLW